MLVKQFFKTSFALPSSLYIWLDRIPLGVSSITAKVSSVLNVRICASLSTVSARVGVMTLPSFSV